MKADSKLDLGTVRVHKKVLAEIIYSTVSGINGIILVQKSVGRKIVDYFTNKSYPGIDIKLDKNGDIQIEVKLRVRYGLNIPSIASDIQNTIKKIYLSGLFKMFPHIKNDDILWFRLSKERYATPMFLRGYEDNMKKIENFDNLYFAGSFKIYPHSRNINNVIKTGFDAAQAILKEKNL